MGTIPPSDRDQILQIADNVAFQLSESIQWSTWHIWKEGQKVSHFFAATKDAETVNKEIRRQIPLFGSCVDIALETSRSFRLGLFSVPALRSYATQVQTLARASVANRDELIHCITALMTEDFCVVIDFSCNFKAMEISCNGYIDSPPYLDMDGNTMRDRFLYQVDADGPQYDQKTLIWSRLGVTTPFRAFDNQELIRRINFGIAKEDGMPGKKGIKLQKAMSSKPAHIPSVLFKETYFATVCRIKVIFHQRQVVMQVPYKDWMLKPENKHLYEKVEPDLLHPINDAVCKLVLRLDVERDPVYATEKVQIMAEVAESHGLKKDDFLEVVESIYEVWAKLRKGKNV